MATTMTGTDNSILKNGWAFKLEFDYLLQSFASKRQIYLYPHTCYLHYQTDFRCFLHLKIILLIKVFSKKGVVYVASFFPYNMN